MSEPETNEAGLRRMANFMDNGGYDERLLIRSADELERLKSEAVPQYAAALVAQLRADLHAAATKYGQLTAEFVALRDEVERLHAEPVPQYDKELRSAEVLVAQLTAERDRLREALKPFAELDISDTEGWSDMNRIFTRNLTYLTLGHLRAARAALNPPKP